MKKQNKLITKHEKANRKALKHQSQYLVKGFKKDPKEGVHSNSYYELQRQFSNTHTTPYSNYLEDLKTERKAKKLKSKITKELTKKKQLIKRVEKKIQNSPIKDLQVIRSHETKGSQIQLKVIAKKENIQQIEEFLKTLTLKERQVFKKTTNFFDSAKRDRGISIVFVVETKSNTEQLKAIYKKGKTQPLKLGTEYSVSAHIFNNPGSRYNDTYVNRDIASLDKINNIIKQLKTNREKSIKSAKQFSKYISKLEKQEKQLELLYQKVLRGEVSNKDLKRINSIQKRHLVLSNKLEDEQQRYEKKSTENSQTHISFHNKNELEKVKKEKPTSAFNRNIENLFTSFNSLKVNTRLVDIIKHIPPTQIEKIISFPNSDHYRTHHTIVDELIKYIESDPILNELYKQFDHNGSIKKNIKEKVKEEQSTDPFSPADLEEAKIQIS